MPRVSISIPVCAPREPEAEARNLVEDPCNEEVICHLDVEVSGRVSKIEALAGR